MNKTLQQVAPPARSLSREWQTFDDRFAGAPSTLGEERNLTQLGRLRAATDDSQA